MLELSVVRNVSRNTMPHGEFGSEASKINTERGGRSAAGEIAGTMNAINAKSTR